MLQCGDVEAQMKADALNEGLNNVVSELFSLLNRETLTYPSCPAACSLCAIKAFTSVPQTSLGSLERLSSGTI